MSSIFKVFKITRIILFLLIFSIILLAFYLYNKNFKITKNDLLNNNNIKNIELKQNNKEDNEIQKDDIKNQDPIIVNYGVIDESQIGENNTSNNIVIGNNNDNNSNNENKEYNSLDKTKQDSNDITTKKDKNISSNTFNNNTNTLNTIKGIDKYYTIQVGSFKDFSKAINLKKLFILKKMVSFIVIRKINGIYYYRVNIGIFKTKDDAINFYNNNKSLLAKYNPIIFLYSK